LNSFATEFYPLTAGVKSIDNMGSEIADSSASLVDKAHTADNIVVDCLGGKILKKGFDLAGAGAGAARKSLGYTDNVVESGVRNAPTRPHANIPDHPSVGPGKPLTQTQKRRC